MKIRHIVVLACATVLLGTGYAADPKAGKPLTEQQSKMATCNKDAADKKGDERKAFMKECLSPSTTSRSRTR